jgi:putative translation initiation factor aIF-2 beta subunit
MDKKNFEEMLDNCYKDLPENVKKNSRFEIPSVTGNISKSKTIIKNFLEISKTLNREIGHFLRFVLKELGVRGEIDETTKYLNLHSKFNPKIINKVILTYFDKFVKCVNCNSPDTELVQNSTTIKCSACGNSRNVTKI